MKKNFAVFVSGYGRGAIEIINYSKKEAIKPKLSLVLSDNPSSFAIKVASKEEIPTAIIKKSCYKSVIDFEKKIISKLNIHNIDYIFLAGWMNIVDSTMINKFTQKIVNIHPSLLPDFKGKNAIGQALDAGVKVTGITTHFVDKTIDGGPIINQVPIQIHKNDNFDSLDKKIFNAGTKLTIQTINSTFI